MFRNVLLLFLAGLATVRAAPPDDGASIDSAVKAVYEVLSGPAGPRDWARFRGLFSDGARLIPIRKSQAGQLGPVVFTVDQFIERASANTAKAGFYEAEVSRRMESFGSIAHVFSTYESRHAPGDKPFSRGINSFQLAREGDSWKVVTILWDTEREGSPLPDKYLR